MRRLSILLSGVLLSLALATSAQAGWGYGWRVTHRHHHHHFSHYGRHWLHRSHYVPRYFSHHAYHHYRAPRYYAPSFHFSYRYVPARTFYYPPLQYYSNPYCVSSALPAYGSPGYGSPAYGGRYDTLTLAEPRGNIPDRTASSWIKVPADPKTATLPRRDDGPGLTLIAGKAVRAADRPAIARMAGDPLTAPERVIKLGDELFRAARYEQALKYYASTAEMNPRMAVAHFRHAQASVAVGHYEQAVTAIKLGLAADPMFLASEFRLQELYDDASARTKHIEALAGAALAQPDDSALLFLIGVFLHFEGESARAAKFLVRAAELAGDDTQHIQLVLQAGQRPPATRVQSAFAKWSESAAGRVH